MNAKTAALDHLGVYRRLQDGAVINRCSVGLCVWVIKRDRETERQRERERGGGEKKFGPSSPPSKDTPVCTDHFRVNNPV